MTTHFTKYLKESNWSPVHVYVSFQGNTLRIGDRDISYYEVMAHFMVFVQSQREGSQTPSMILQLEVRIDQHFNPVMLVFIG